MKKIHKVCLELFALHAIIFYFAWELTKINITTEVILIVSLIYVLVFFLIIFSRLVYLIDNLNILLPLLPIDFKQLNIGEQYQVISKNTKNAKLENEKGNEVIVKNFTKYAHFVGVNDYFIINSISPLNIDWIVKENKNEQINVYI